MELQQLKLGDKVKLELVQPQIKCSGRDDVSFVTRGKVKGFDGNRTIIKFKSKGQLVEVEFLAFLNHCYTEGFEDLKIK